MVSFVLSAVKKRETNVGDIIMQKMKKQWNPVKGGYAVERATGILVKIGDIMPTLDETPERNWTVVEPVSPEAGAVEHECYTDDLREPTQVELDSILKQEGEVMTFLRLALPDGSGYLAQDFNQVIDTINDYYGNEGDSLWMPGDKIEIVVIQMTRKAYDALVDG